ncbi:uncharacterized protein LOC135484983 isoform X2 [Lineus longissimus]|uniref:uncharacterized protein LOC135484983 isoform X2 n=1 Tax=Lineus longissimus TaxID=88925 RepID=UPI00315DDF0F
MAFLKTVVLTACIVTSLVDSDCLKGQFYSEGTGKCADCSTHATVCDKFPTKCPRQCLQFFLENAQDTIESLQTGIQSRETRIQSQQKRFDAITGWEFNNCGIVLICIIAVGFVIVVLLIITIKRLKGAKKKQADLEMGNQEEELPLVPPNCPTPSQDVTSTTQGARIAEKITEEEGTQTPEKTTEEKETQVDKLPTEEIGHQVEDEETGQKVQSPEPEPTSGLEDQDLDDDAQTAVKTPFTDENDEAKDELVEVSSEVNPKVALSDHHFDNLNTAQGGEEVSLGATGGSD